MSPSEKVELEMSVDAMRSEADEIESAVKTCSHCECFNQIQRIAALRNEADILEARRVELELWED